MTGIISDNVGRPSGLIKAASGGTSTGAWTKIKTLTAGADSTLDFVDGTDDVVLDSTYPIYRFSFINIHAETSGEKFTVNFRDGGSAYDATKTTSYFLAYQDEAGSGDAALSYITSKDLAQSTDAQPIAQDTNVDNDASISGYLHLFNPSSTTFVKHFISNTQSMTLSSGNPYSYQAFVTGYCNVTAAIDGVQFSMSSGNIDSGKIKLYGLGDS
jgi:hypothetical protein